MLLPMYTTDGGSLYSHIRGSFPSTALPAPQSDLNGPPMHTNPGSAPPLTFVAPPISNEALLFFTTTQPSHPTDGMHFYLEFIHFYFYIYAYMHIICT